MSLSCDVIWAWPLTDLLTVKNMWHLPLMKRHFIESSYSHYGACVFRRFWTKHQGWAEKTMPLSLNCVFVNRCGLASTLTVKRFSMCFHKNPFLVSWACQKSFFSNLHNVVSHASFRSSKKAVVTKQSKTPSYETPNWLFCPLFDCLPLWLHERFWCLFYLFWCLL